MNYTYRIEHDPLGEMYMLLFWGKDHQNTSSWMQIATARKKDDLYELAKKFDKLKKKPEYFIVPIIELPNGAVQYVDDPSMGT